MAAARTIIVAGAGIGGLTAALALAAKGFRVVILEKAERLEEAGAGLQLSPNASRILVDLGLKDIRILTNNPKKIIGLEGYGLHVSEQIRIEAPSNPHNEAYLQTKRDRMGHILHHQGLALDEEMIRDEQARDGGSEPPVEQ